MKDDDNSRDAFLQAINARKNPPRRARMVNDNAARGLGFVVLLMGVFLFWTGTWMPLQDARAHAARIDFSMKAAICAPLLLGTGLLYSVMGSSAWRIIGVSGRPSRLGIALGAALGVGSLAYAFWIRGQLEALGYVFQR